MFTYRIIENIFLNQFCKLVAFFQAKDLPKSTTQEENFQPTDIAEDFKIAWRYSQNPIYDSTPHHTSISFGHTFDMSTKFCSDELQNVGYWPTDKSQGIYIIFTGYRLNVNGN